MEPKYIFALVLLAFVTGIMECMNHIFLMVLLVLVTGLMELINAVYYHHFVAFPHLGDLEERNVQRWDEFARRVSLQ